jgi:hypothetical protein
MVLLLPGHAVAVLAAKQFFVAFYEKVMFLVM